MGLTQKGFGEKIREPTSALLEKGEVQTGKEIWVRAKRRKGPRGKNSIDPTSHPKKRGEKESLENRPTLKGSFSKTA